MDASSFKRLTQIDHILQRPATYIGSTFKAVSQIWVYDNQNKKIKKITHEYPPALEQLYQEAFSNANDNIHRSRQLGIDPGRFEQTVTTETASFYNEGAWIPVEIHPEEKIYVPELVFFNLLTSSNYDDTQDRTWIGQNGIGIKAVGVFADWMIIECADPRKKLLYKQRCDTNMKNVHPPEITEYTGKVGYTRVTFKPDFPRFGMTCFTPEMINMFMFFTASASFTSKAPIVFNGQTFHNPSIAAFASLFTDETAVKLCYNDANVEFCLVDAPEKGFNVSFVNGGFTKKGGAHVNDILKLFSSSILEKLNQKKKVLDVRDVKKHLGLIISCTVVNPRYTTQGKEEFVAPVPKIEISPSYLKKVEKWSFTKQLALYADIKSGNGPEKESKKRSKYVIISKAIDANFAGEPENYKRSIAALTEGDSARTFVIHYRQLLEKGEDIIGVMPLRGKCLNVDKAKADKIQTNEELRNIREFIGLRPDLDYMTEEARSTLRYGHCLLATDADVDGFHIQGLLLNIFGTSYVSLLKSGFVWGLITPVLKLTWRNNVKFFYTEPEYEEYVSQFDEKTRATITSDNVKYYKGLGGWDESDFTQENFNIFKIVQYVYDENAPSTLKMVFSNDKGMTALRKEWVSTPITPSPEYVSTDGQNMTQSISNFINSKVKLYTSSCNQRAIPCLVDNYVPSRRKVQYALKKRNIPETRPVKVENFAGYVSENTSYQHGADNIDNIIFNMGQSFPGSNNIPLVRGGGNFGTQLEGGKDHASGRYTNVSNHRLNGYIFRKEDDLVLKYSECEGAVYEPDYYCPIICMVAVNGAEGIGMGHSTKCPSFNPKKIMAWQRSWMSRFYPEEGEIPEPFPRLVPWYRGFRGEIRPDGPGKYVSIGKFQVVGNEIIINELPVGMWILKYKEFVDKLLIEKKITDRRYKTSTDGDYWFRIKNFTLPPTSHNLNLVTSFSTSNLVFYDDKGNLCKYASIESLLFDYCTVRYRVYGERLKAQLKVLEAKIIEKEAKIRFIRDVVTKELVLTEPNVDQKMTERGHSSELLSMSLKSITPAGLQRNEKDLFETKQEYDELSKTTPRRLWLKELKELETEYDKMYPEK